MISPGPEIIIKMSLELFHKVHAGAIETLFDEQNQVLFRRADLGKYLGIEDIKHNFKDFPSHYIRSRLNLVAEGQDPSLERTKIPSTGSLKNLSNGLDFYTQTWRWLTNVMI